MAIVLGADALKGPFTRHSTPERAGPMHCLAAQRHHALTAFQTPGQDHRFIAVPSLCLHAADGTHLLHAVYAVDAATVGRWTDQGFIAGIDALHDEDGRLLNATDADIFTHLNEAERVVEARNEDVLRRLQDHTRQRANRSVQDEPPLWRSESLTARYRTLERPGRASPTFHTP